MRLEIDNIKKSFSGKEVLHGVSLDTDSGKATGFIGRNGAGKTTTIRILMDVFKPDSGEIRMDGKKFKRKDYRIGYLPEERGMYPKSKILDQLIFFGQIRNMGRVEAKKSALLLLDRVGLLDYKDKMLETLSKGNQQKIQIAQTLINDPDIVILDEPFSGLDPVNAEVLVSIVKDEIKRGKLLIFSSHQMGYVEEFCDNIAIIKDGNVALKGNLNDIKKEKGDGKLEIEILNMNPDDVLQMLNKDFPSVDFYVIGGRLIADLKNKDNKSFSKEIIDRYDIKSISMYEPSLKDIFIETAGDYGERSEGDI